jgi:ATP phosphoribosyltransferase
VSGGLRICVPLGALFDGAVDALGRAGLDVAPLREAGRRLVVPAGDGTVFITTRPSDVPTYVESGAADLGIVGRDVLRERGPDVYELLDLGFGECRMVYATPAGDDPTPAALAHLGSVRVATKYPVAAAAHFAATGRQAEVVKVNGSVELAPLVGLAHGIVDLVATGRTLRDNGLVEREVIFRSSARLVANRVSHKLEAVAVDRLVEALARDTAAPSAPGARVDEGGG